MAEGSKGRVVQIIGTVVGRRVPARRVAPPYSAPSSWTSRANGSCSKSNNTSEIAGRDASRWGPTDGLGARSRGKRHRPAGHRACRRTVPGPAVQRGRGCHRQPRPRRRRGNVAYPPPCPVICRPTRHHRYSGNRYQGLRSHHAFRQGRQDRRLRRRRRGQDGPSSPN